MKIQYYVIEEGVGFQDGSNTLEVGLEKLKKFREKYPNSRFHLEVEDHSEFEGTELDSKFED